MKLASIDAAWNGIDRCRECGIRDLALFANLVEDDFQHIHQPIDELLFKAGDVLYRSGEEVNSVMTIRSGLVKLLQYLPDGNRRIVRVLRQGDLAGLEHVAGGPALHDAVALHDVEVCRIPLTVVSHIQQNSPVLHQQLMDRWRRALADADQWLTHLSTGTSKLRVARLLLMLSSSCKQEVFFLPTREDIGAMLALTTESASKATAEFRRNGWLDVVDQQHARIDRSALEAFVAG